MVWGVLLLNFFEKLGTVHAGHAHIGDNHIESLTGHQLQGLPAARSEQDILLVS
jgi:hypothetical protein